MRFLVPDMLKNAYFTAYFKEKRNDTYFLYVNTFVGLFRLQQRASTVYAPDVL